VYCGNVRMCLGKGDVLDRELGEVILVSYVLRSLPSVTAFF
jgi:hypothetical protein